MSLASVMSRPDVWRGDRFATASSIVPSGFDQLDAALPGGGWPRGALTELLLEREGIGELRLLMPALARIKADGGWSVLIAPPHAVHAPAWTSEGADLSRFVVVSPAASRDVLWATEQALGSGAPQAVISWCEQAQPRQLRRLQVAAVAGNALAFLFRPLRAATEASVAPLRLRVTTGTGGTLTLEIFKRRGPPQVQPLHIAVPRPARLPRELHHVSARSFSLVGHPATAAVARSASAPIA